MEYNTLNFHEIKSRMDPGYYRNIYLDLEESLKTIGSKPLEKLIENFYEGRITPKLGEYCKDGYPFIRAQNIQFDRIDNTDVPRIREDVHKQISKAHAMPRDILLTIDGALLGKSAVVPEELGECSITNHSVRIVIKEEVNPYYISSVLNSKIGQLQIKRSMSGSAQPGLRINVIKNILIPEPPEGFDIKIEKIVKEALVKRNYAINKYKEAKLQVRKHLQVNKLKLFENKFFNIHYSDINTSRYDPEHYKPIFKEIKTLFSELENNYEIQPIKKFADVKTGKQIETFYNYEDGIPYYSIKDINHLKMDKTDARYVSENDKKELYDLIIKKNDLLLAITGATIGKIGIYLDDDDALISGDLARIRITDKKVKTYYLLVYIDDILGQLQIQQNSYGTTNKHLSKTSVENILVPILLKSQQEKIFSLIDDSFSLLSESEKMLKKCKLEIEKLVMK